MVFLKALDNISGSSTVTCSFQFYFFLVAIFFVSRQ